jgi:hypothetical protein
MQDQHQPVLRVRVGEAVVATEHGKQHRQREVGVVHTALLAALAVDRVHRLARLDVSHHRPLARDDPEEDIGAHAGGDHRATNKKAARPANQWQASQAAAQTTSKSSAPTMASPCLR